MNYLVVQKIIAAITAVDPGLLAQVRTSAAPQVQRLDKSAHDQPGDTASNFQRGYSPTIGRISALAT
jgi:hypothetical protein